jgi:hypothetical protein
MCSGRHPSLFAFFHQPGNALLADPLIDCKRLIGFVLPFLDFLNVPRHLSKLESVEARQACLPRMLSSKAQPFDPQIEMRQSTMSG